MGGAKVHLHALGFGPRLVAELDQGHQHGQAQSAHQDVEDPGYVGQAQGLGRLVLQEKESREEEEEEEVVEDVEV